MSSMRVLTVSEFDQVAGGDADPTQNYQHMREYYMVSMMQQGGFPFGFDPTAAAEKFCEYTFAGLASAATAEIPPPAPLVAGAAGAVLGSQICPGIVKGIQAGAQAGWNAINRK